MLRLSECTSLPSEATCALIASDGFNGCLKDAAAGTGGKTLDQCFKERTSYAGMRTCDVAHPCRDDYICLSPLGYNAANGHQKFEERRRIVATIYDPQDLAKKSQMSPG